MTLDEAIKHCLEVAEQNEFETRIYDELNRSGDEEYRNNHCQCAADHRQLAKWLTELKERREADVQPVKTGRWSECYTDSHHYSGICTVCGKASIRSIKENPLEYCPKCGAKMDLPEATKG